MQWNVVFLLLYCRSQRKRQARNPPMRAWDRAWRTWGHIAWRTKYQEYRCLGLYHFFSLLWPLIERNNNKQMYFKIHYCVIYSVAVVVKFFIYFSDSIGCGLDRLKWTSVSEILDQVFKHTDISITVYSLPQREETTVMKENRRRWFMEMLIIEMLMYFCIWSQRDFFFSNLETCSFLCWWKIKLSFYKRTHINSYTTSSGIIIEPFCNDCWDYFQNILIYAHH